MSQMTSIHCLVTGGAGFIGSHVAEELLRMGCQVVVLDDLSGGHADNVPPGAALEVASILDRAKIKELFEQHHFDYVFHLAAYAAEGLSHFIKHFNYQNNLIGSVNLINASVNYEVECFVFTSSIAVYGSAQLPMTESMLPQPKDSYGIAKYAVEMELCATHDMFGLDYIVFRPHNVYGERQNIGDKYRITDRDLLVIYAAATSLFYALLIPPAWGYPRYQTPVVPVIAILAAAVVVPAFQALPRRARLVVAGLGVAAFVYKLAVIGDPLWSLYAVTFETDTGDLMQRLAQGISIVVSLVIPIGIVLAVVCLLALRWKIRLLPTIVLALGVLSLAHTASTTAIQVPADYSTRYRYTYDYADLLQTVADLKQTGGYVLAVKDVLYYTGLPGEEIYGYVCPTCSPQALIDKIHSTRVDALAWTTKEDNRSPNISANPAIVQALNVCYTRATHGVFIVYLRRPNSPCP